MNHDVVLDKNEGTREEIETLKVKFDCTLQFLLAALVPVPAGYLLPFPQDIHSGHSHIWLPDPGPVLLAPFPFFL